MTSAHRVQPPDLVAMAHAAADDDLALDRLLDLVLRASDCDHQLLGEAKFLHDRLPGPHDSDAFRRTSSVLATAYRVTTPVPHTALDGAREAPAAG